MEKNQITKQMLMDKCVEMLSFYSQNGETDRIICDNDGIYSTPVSMRENEPHVNRKDKVEIVLFPNIADIHANNKRYDIKLLFNGYIEYVSFELSIEERELMIISFEEHKSKADSRLKKNIIDSCVDMVDYVFFKSPLQFPNAFNGKKYNVTIEKKTGLMQEQISVEGEK